MRCLPGPIVLLVATVLTVPCAAQEPPAPQAEAVASPAVLSLGDFALRVAAELKLPPPAAGFTPESAAWALLHKGIRLRPELASPLVEADVVTALAGMGYRIRTGTPSRVMTRDRLDAVLQVFFSPPPS